MGSHLFQEKGCAHCHAVNGVGGGLAPDLGSERLPESSLNQLVTEMWNHAPRMWERMRQEKLTYPDLSYQDMAHLFAYLYTVRYVDEPGDLNRGRQLFESKGCIRCHSFHGVGGKVGPDLSSVGADTPIAWTQTMWNHAPAMEAAIGKLGLTWPKFQGSEMNDLLAYVREVSGGPRWEFKLLPADPGRGWQLFQSKSCVVCHSVRGEGGHFGPELDPRREPPLTIVQFAGLMWNHSPEMWREMQARKIPRPTFTGREMADLIAFLQSVRYFEPGGSPQIGEMLFARRGCSKCHGVSGEGSPSGPALRGRGSTFTTVTFATELWRHGPKMYQRTQQLGLPWPNLVESDIGDLLVFLNTPPTEHRADVKSRSSDNKQ
jgi:mono/diheme cytochrome c family protein